MQYLVDIIHAVVASLFFATVAKRKTTALISFTLYFLLLSVITTNKIAPSALNPDNNFISFLHFRSLGLLIGALIIISIKNYAKDAIERINTSLYKKGIFHHEDNRFMILFKLWSFTIFITSIIGYLNYKELNIISRDFYTSWTVNVIFFSLFGLIGIFISLRMPHKEEFENRVGILFAAPVETDKELKRAALQHISNSIKRIGFVSSITERRVTIEEYNSDYNAYRAHVTVTSELINLFGDIDAVDDMKFSVSPDDFSSCNKYPDPIGQIVSLVVGDEERIKGQPYPIKKGSGALVPELFSVGKEPKIFIFKYWSWFKVDVPATFTPGRYCRHLSVTVVNRMKSDEHNVAVVERPSPVEVRSPERRTLRYGDDWHLTRESDLEPNKEYKLFVLRNPEFAYQAHTA
jgi:hypothetical protein